MSAPPTFGFAIASRETVASGFWVAAGFYRPMESRTGRTPKGQLMPRMQAGRSLKIPLVP